MGLQKFQIITVRYNACQTFLWLFLVVIGIACQSKTQNHTLDEDLLRSQVDSTMSAYQDAISKHDAERINSFYLNSPEFEVIANGEIIKYDDWVKIQSVFYSSVSEVKGGFSDFHSILLGPEAVIISGFRDQTTVDKVSVAIRRVGAASWVWTKREGRWAIIHINSYYSETQVP